MARKPGLARLMNAFAEATASLTRDRRERDAVSPAPGADAWGYGSFEWAGYPDFKLPDECPVTPLGINGDVAFFVDAMGQVIAVPASARKEQQLFDLFKGHSNFVHHHWPGRLKAPQPDGSIRWLPAYPKVEMRQAWNCLVNAAARKGLFDPSERMRGRGGWAIGSNREAFLWHAGDLLFASRDGMLVESEPGDLDGKFYAAGPQLPAPWAAPVSDDDSPGLPILRHLQSWRYKRQDLDPVLLVGAIACSFYGGALDQRPVTLITGDRGQGKSSMQHFIKRLLDTLLIDAANTTAAGIYQRLKRDSLAVWVDEFEGSAGANLRATAIVELARQAYSGALALRGGSDHQGTQFQLSSAFFFSAINPPPMEPADYSRMAIINLKRLDVSAEMPSFELDHREAGRMILRRLMDNWDRFNGHLDQWRRTFRRSGLDSRFCDTFGTLLAGAHVLLGDAGMEDAGVPITQSEEQIGQWVLTATAHERSLIVDNWRACLEHLLSSIIQGFDAGKKPTIGQVLREYETSKIEVDALRERLDVAGLGLIDLCGGRAEKARAAMRARPDWWLRNAENRMAYLLAVPYDMPALAAVFRETKWAGGGWRTALQQAPASVCITGEGIPETVKINRATKRALMIDLGGYDAETGGAGDGEA